MDLVHWINKIDLLSYLKKIRILRFILYKFRPNIQRIMCLRAFPSTLFVYSSKLICIVLQICIVIQIDLFSPPNWFFSPPNWFWCFMNWIREREQHILHYKHKGEGWRQLEVRNLFAIHFVTECIALKKRKTFCHRIISFMFMHNLN